MREDIAVIDGLRTPMGKAGGVFKDISADDLGSFLLKEFITRMDNKLDLSLIEEVIIGNVAQPAGAANIARVIALKAGLATHIPAYTVHRNCASGMQSISSAISKIRAGEGDMFIAGGVESMSNIPLFFGKQMTNFFENMFKSKTIGQKLKILSTFRPGFLKPVIGVKCGLTDPVSGMIMGMTAEILAREFAISREMQDEFAMRSHNLAEEATKKGIFKEEIAHIYSASQNTIIDSDEGIRNGQNMGSLAKLRPYFDRKNGTVTVGNSSQITDGAAFVIITSRSKAKELGVTPLGYIKDYAYAGLEPERMGLGPVYATAKLFAKNNINNLQNIDLIEINEAFAAQALANEIAFNSDKFASDKLGRSQKIGEIDRDILNVNGGAIALGHPVGMSGTRIVIHMLKELRRRNKNRGLATLCVGGGQGVAFLLEVE